MRDCSNRRGIELRYSADYDDRHPSELDVLLRLKEAHFEQRRADVFNPAIALNLAQGVRAVDTDLVEMAQVFRFSPAVRLRSLWLPAIAPFLLAGARFGLSLAWKVIVLVEIFGMSSGVGYQLGVQFAERRGRLGVDARIRSGHGDRRVRDLAEPRTAGQPLATRRALMSAAISLRGIDKTFEHGNHSVSHHGHGSDRHRALAGRQFRQTDQTWSPP